MATLRRNWVKSGTGAPPDDFGDGFFLREIELQCEFTTMAFAQMQEVYAANPKNPSLLALSHVMLVFAGNVAKLLSSSKGASPQAKARTERLVEQLGVASLDFARIREARNFLEHFDERLDRYFRVPNGMLIHRMVEDHDPESVTLDDGRTFRPKVLQLLNTKDLHLSLYGERFELRPILEVVQTVKSRVRSIFKSQGVPGYEDAA